MRWLFVAAAACGRVGFDARPDAALPVGHDEDGDGVPDAIDVCPHIPDDQRDRDGDGVGDACDPEPDIPRQRIARFATMQPTDQPFDLGGTGVWTQAAHSVHFDGNGVGGLGAPMAAGNIRIAIGVDIEAVVGTMVQHQLATAALSDPAQPHYFVELDDDAGYDAADVSYFNGTTYNIGATQLLASNVHTGSVFLQATEVLDTSVTLDAGWPGEPYHAAQLDNLYQGGDRITFIVNNAVIDVRWICIITW